MERSFGDLRILLFVPKDKEKPEIVMGVTKFSGSFRLTSLSFLQMASIELRQSQTSRDPSSSSVEGQQIDLGLGFLDFHMIRVCLPDFSCISRESTNGLLERKQRRESRYKRETRSETISGTVPSRNG